MDQQRPRTNGPPGGPASRADLGRPSRRVPHYRRLCLATLIVLALTFGGLWRSHAAPGAFGDPVVTVTPTSGLPGSTVSISAVYFPTFTGSRPSTITFDNGGQQVAVGQQTIIVCTVIPGAQAQFYGFGLACTGTDVTFQVPAAAAPGPHTVTVTVTGDNIPNGQFVRTAPFTVLAAATQTQTTTPSVTPSATGTATPTGTSTQAAATGTSTAVPTTPPSATPPGLSTYIAFTATPTTPPSATPSGLSTYVVYTATPTASATTVAQPATATSTATVPPSRSIRVPTSTPSATATPAPKGDTLILAKPAFAAGTLLVSVRAGSGSSIHIAFIVGHLDHGHLSADYSLSSDGLASTSNRFTKLLHIEYHHRGQATLTVTIKTGTAVRSATRQYQFSPG